VKIAAGLALMLFALPGPRPQDPAVKAALKKFDDDFHRNGAKPDQKIQAIIALAVHKNEHVVKALAPALTKNEPAVRIVAARELARFSAVPQAGTAVLAALRNNVNGGNKYASVRIMLIRALGDLKVKEAAQDVDRAIEDRNVWIAKAAIDAAGKIRYRNSVDTLIGALKRIEGPMGDAQIALNPLVEAFREVTIAGLLGAEGGERQVSERDFLKTPINQALQGITRVPYATSKEWDTWWKSNKASFEVKE
jgi:HEAT repeat protein